ncbi:MAG TPA: helix-turn-helix domain-containing protein [Streptosporangiaceae bacterium]
MPNPITQPENARSRRTRAAVLDAARELIAERGFAATTMAAVADRAGVTRRAVYLHFATKADLLAALFDYVSDREQLAASLRRVWRAPGPVAALQEWARHLARFHPHIMDVDLAAECERASDPDAAAHRATVIADQRAACRRLVGWLHDEGVLAPSWTPATATDMLWALMSSALIRALLVDCGWSTRSYARQLSALLVRTFVRDGAQPAGAGETPPPADRAAGRAW